LYHNERIGGQKEEKRSGMILKKIDLGELEEIVMEQKGNLDDVFYEINDEYYKYVCRDL
jgi:hypothetical protein